MISCLSEEKTVHSVNFSLFSFPYFMPLPNFHASACTDEILEQVNVLLLVIRTARFDSRWCRNFFFDNPSGSTMALGVDSACNRNEYQEYFLESKGGLCVGLTTLPLSCASCLEIWESQPPGTLRACPDL